MDEFLKFANNKGEIVLKIDATNGEESMLTREVDVIVGDSSITGTLVDLQGKPIIKNVKDMPIIIYDSASGRRFVTTANESGEYQFPSIPMGTYFFESGDLNVKYSLSGSVEVGRGDDAVVENTVDDNSNFALSVKFANKRSSVYIISGGEGYSHRVGIPQRDMSKVTALKRGCEKIDNNTYRVVSDLKEQECKEEITIPKGSKLVGFNIKVRTEEQLQIGEMNYPYNDKWEFNVAFGKNTLNEKGQVPVSYEDGGLGTNYTLKEYTYCIDASELTKNIGVKANINLTSQDIGDMNNPTSVIMEKTDKCSGIKDFSNYKTIHFPAIQYMTFLPTDPVYLFGGIQTSRYVTTTPVVSILTDNSSHIAKYYKNVKFPLRVIYAKDKSDNLTKSKLYVVIGGEDIDMYPNSDDFFKSANMNQVGNTDAFKDMPDVVTMANDNYTFPAANIYNKISDIDSDQRSKVQFKLKLYFTNTTTKETIEVSKNFMSLELKDTFTPLFELTDIDPATWYHTKRRFGSGATDQADSQLGGDGWAKKSTIEWLSISNLVVNDISSIHGARAVTSKKNRCILGHASHTDGNQMDVLYANPRKGLGDVDNKTTTDKLTVLTEGSSHDNLSKIMEGFNLPDDFSVFNFDNITYKTDGTTNCNISDPTCLGNLNGTNMGKGIRYLGQYAGKQVSTKVDNKTIDVHDRVYDDHVKYWGYTTFKDWIVTNRLLIRYSEAIAAEFFGNKVGFHSIVGMNYKGSAINNFRNMIVFANSPDNMTSMGISHWPRANFHMAPDHYHHWHFNLPLTKDR